MKAKRVKKVSDVEMAREIAAKLMHEVDREDELRVYRKAREFGWMVYRCINRDDGFYAVLGGETGQIWEGTLDKVEEVLDMKKRRDEGNTLHSTVMAIEEANEVIPF